MATTTGWIGEVQAAGGNVLVGLPPDGITSRGRELLEAVRHVRTTADANRSVVNLANRGGLHVVLAHRELRPQQLRNFQEAHARTVRDEPATSRRERHNAYRTFETSRGSVHRMAREHNLRILPMACTCPPCGPTRRPTPA